MSRSIRILHRAASRWDRHSAPTLSAAMAFYVLVSVAPLSVIAVGVTGRALGEVEVRSQLVETSERFLDPVASRLLAEILETPWVRRVDPIGNAGAILMLLFASTAGLNHLRGSLNRIFESPERAQGRVKGALRGRAIAFLAVLLLVATILASLTVRTAVVALDTAVGIVDVPLLPPAFALLEVVSIVAALTGLFAMVMRVLPDRKLPWRPLLKGAFASSVLFVFGEWVIGQYLGRVALGSAFGAAGSSVVLAAWVYYSSMVFFFGAAMTFVFAEGAVPPLAEGDDASPA